MPSSSKQECVTNQIQGFVNLLNATFFVFILFFYLQLLFIRVGDILQGGRVWITATELQQRIIWKNWHSFAYVVVHKR